MKKLCLLLTFVLSFSSFSYANKTKCETVIETGARTSGALCTGFMGGIAGACLGFVATCTLEVTKIAFCISSQIMFHPYRCQLTALTSSDFATAAVVGGVAGAVYAAKLGWNFIKHGA